MSDFLSRITAPIPGGSPFGADVNYDADYERLKGEMGKLGDIDVGVVEALSMGILTGKSKDARAMAFLAYAMLRQGDIGRLADVFCALADYCADSFDQIFPLRESAKLAALRWLSEVRFSSGCSKIEASVGDKQNVARLKEALVRLRPALEKRFASSGAPFPTALHKRVLEWERSIEAALAPPLPRKEEGVAKDGAAASVATGAKASDKLPEAVVIKLSRAEYQELLRCVGVIESLLKKNA